MIFQAFSLFAITLAALAAIPPQARPILLSKSDSEAVLDLHQFLIEIRSITGNEKAAADWLVTYLRSQHWTVEHQEVSSNRYNVFAYGNKRETTILLTSHIDTVPPYLPYYYNASDDMIGGRGSVDAKSSVASMIIAAQGIKEHLQDDISLLFVIGEETGGDGMRAFSSWSKRPTSHEIIVFGEPTERRLVCGHKGILSFEVKATGKAAHSGYPWLGVSANDILVEALNELLKLRQHLPWSDKYGNTTMNFGLVKGGVAGNVVAATATANITTRLAAGTPKQIIEQTIDALKGVKVAAEKEGGNLEVKWGGEGYSVVDIDCDVDGFDTTIVSYGTDVPNLSGNHKRYLYGPGSIFVAHSNNEALKRKDLEQAVLDYRRLILKATQVRENGLRSDLVLENQIQL